MRLQNLAAIASSGLRLESQRLAQSAANTANLETPGYTARRIVAASRPGGGVTGTSVPSYGSRAAGAPANGATPELSNADLVEESVTQLSSVRAFQANIAVLQTADAVLGELVNRRA